MTLDAPHPDARHPSPTHLAGPARGLREAAEALAWSAGTALPDHRVQDDLGRVLVALADELDRFADALLAGPRRVGPIGAPALPPAAR